LTDSGSINKDSETRNEFQIICEKIRSTRQLKILFRICNVNKQNVDRVNVSNIQRQMNIIYQKEMKKPFEELKETYKHYLRETVQRKARKVGMDNINEYIDELRQIIRNIITLREFDLLCVSEGFYPPSALSSTSNQNSGEDHIDFIDVIRSLQVELKEIEEKKFPL